jgi:hypothetical protein
MRTQQLALSRTTAISNRWARSKRSSAWVHQLVRRPAKQRPCRQQQHRWRQHRQHRLQQHRQQWRAPALCAMKTRRTLSTDHAATDKFAGVSTRDATMIAHS